MTEEQQKEQFSIAYVRAVAAAARVNISRQEVDADSVDISFCVKSVAGNPVSPKLDAQLKCATELDGTETEWRYPLKIKNYRELIGTHYVPRILIVVLIPTDVTNWVQQTAESLSLYRCGYWASLRELVPSNNETRVTVSIPKANLFSPAALKSLLPAGTA
jgi:hypothetical protein